MFAIYKFNVQIKDFENFHWKLFQKEFSLYFFGPKYAISSKKKKSLLKIQQNMHTYVSWIISL